MTIGELHKIKRKALENYLDAEKAYETEGEHWIKAKKPYETAIEDYAKAEKLYKTTKAAYHTASDAFADAIAPYQATMSGYLEPVGTKDSIPAYRIICYSEKSEIYLIPDKILNVEVGSYIEKGEYLVDTGPNAP